jgi:hypothetical protein
MGPHRKVGIYVGFQSPSINKYLEPLMGDLFTAWYADSIFDEKYFSTLGETLSTKKNAKKSIEMLKVFQPLIHVLQNVKYKFKISYICRNLQMNCQMLSPTIKVSLNLSFPHGMRQKEWWYQIKPLNSHSIVRGGEVQRIRLILMLARKDKW